MNKTVLKAAARYRVRISQGELIMRDSSNRLQWASGRPAGAKTVHYMLETRQICELDTDLFGDFAHGQTLGDESRCGGDL